jgi:cytochrome c oxidase subunit 1
MAMAGVFGLFSATYYWFPQISATLSSVTGGPARLMSERLGRLHFWGTILGAYATFLPMHITGLAGEPRHYAQLTVIPGQAGAHLLAATLPLQHQITYAALFLAAAQLPFLVNLFYSLRNGALAPGNPWGATTLEWHPDLAANRINEESAVQDTAIMVYRAPCDYQDGKKNATFLPQWVSESIAE